MKTDNARPKDYRIVQHVIHSDYKPPSLYNDIALFRLEVDVEFTAYVRPICLNSDPLLNPTVQIATGWGRTSTGFLTALNACEIATYIILLFCTTFLDGPISADLLKVDLNIIPADRCNSSYFGTLGQKLKYGILTDSQICAGSFEGGKDTCSVNDT